MKEFKYIISRLNDTFFGKVMSFTKTKNSFNKIYEEFKNKQEISDQVYNLLHPLNGYFDESFKMLNEKYTKKEEKDSILYEFLDQTEMVVLFWSDNFDDFEIIMKDLPPLQRKFKYLGKIIKTLVKIKIDSEPR